MELVGIEGGDGEVVGDGVAGGVLLEVAVEDGFAEGLGVWVAGAFWEVLVWEGEVEEVFAESACAVGDERGVGLVSFFGDGADPEGLLGVGGWVVVDDLDFRAEGVVFVVCELEFACEVCVVEGKGEGGVWDSVVGSPPVSVVFSDEGVDVHSRVSSLCRGWKATVMELME